MFLKSRIILRLNTTQLLKRRKYPHSRISICGCFAVMMRLYLLKVFVILIISIEGKRSQFTLLRAIFPRAYGSTKENNTNFLQEEADCQTNSSYDMMVWKKLLLSEGWSCLLTPPSKNALYSTLLQLDFFLQKLILKFVNEHHNKENTFCQWKNIRTERSLKQNVVGIALL